MADNRIKRSQTKSSPTKERHHMNIPPTVHSTDYSSSDATKSDKSAAIDSLFDSGYDSQTVSKTSIDLESDFDQKMIISSNNCPNLDFSSDIKLQSKQWTDSGLSITSDSGLNIEELDQKVDKSCELRTIELLGEAYSPDQDGDTYLHLSIIKGVADVCYALIRIVPHPDFLDIYNHLLQSPLHLAALTRQSNMVRRLIICGASLDLRDRHGNTPLHIACAQSDSDCVVRILSPITSTELMDAKVVNYAVSAHHLSVQFLDLKNYKGQTCLHLAANNKNKTIIDLLVKSGANVNAQEGKSGKSILHFSVENKSVELVHFLVNRCKADVNVRSYAGHTPLHLAWMLSTTQPNSAKLRTIIKYLLESGAEPIQPPNFDSDSSSDED